MPQYCLVVMQEKLWQLSFQRKKTFIVGAPTATGLTEEQKQRIKEMLARAESYDEVQRLDRILASGKLPKELMPMFSTETTPMAVDSGTEENRNGTNGSDENKHVDGEQKQMDIS